MPGCTLPLPPAPGSINVCASSRDWGLFSASPSSPPTPAGKAAGGGRSGRSLERPLQVGGCCQAGGCAGPGQDAGCLCVHQVQQPGPGQGVADRGLQSVAVLALVLQGCSEGRRRASDTNYPGGASPPPCPGWDLPGSLRLCTPSPDLSGPGSFQTHGRFGFCFLCLRLVVPQMRFAACHCVPRTSRAESLLATYLGSQLPQLQNGDKTPHGEQTFLMGICDNQQGHLNEASGDLTQNQ